eukprot:365200-Chlamydomonas_euryale.AAC.16
MSLMWILSVPSVWTGHWRNSPATTSTPPPTERNSDLSSSACLVWMLGWPYPDLLAGISCLRPGRGQTEYRREAGPYSL